MFLPLLIALTCAGISSASETESTTETPAEHEEELKSLVNCGFLVFNLDEYEIFFNGTAYVPSHNKMYEPSSYSLKSGGLLAVCPPSSKETDDPLEYVRRTAVGISLVCMVVHLVVFAMVKDMRNLPGYNLASLCLSLLVSYLSMMVAGTDLSGNATLCVTFAILTQFFFLSSFLWMFVISFTVFRSILIATSSLRVCSKEFKIKQYLYNCCVSWGTSLVFSIAAYLADTLEVIPEEYKPHFKRNCWFGQKQSLLIFFAGPFLTIICLNFLLFGLSVYIVYFNRMSSGKGCSHSKDYILYFRLFVIMGSTWVIGAAITLIQKVWLWYVFSLLNTLQMFFILLYFTCTKKVRKFFRMKMSGARRTSEQNLMSNFQLSPSTPVFSTNTLATARKSPVPLILTFEHQTNLRKEPHADFPVVCFYTNFLNKAPNKMDNGDGKIILSV